MALVFKTEEDHADSVVFTGVGVAPPNGRGGVLVEEAAQTMPELQSVGGVPLEKKDLQKAAEALADKFDGLTVVNADVTRDQLAVEAGATTLVDPPADQVARERYLRTFGHLDPENLAPEGVKASELPAMVASGFDGIVVDQPRPDIGPILGEGEDAVATADPDAAPAPDATPPSGSRSTAKKGDA